MYKLNLILNYFDLILIFFGLNNNVMRNAILFCCFTNLDSNTFLKE